MTKGNPKKTAAMQQTRQHTVQLGTERCRPQRGALVCDDVESTNTGVIESTERIHDSYIDLRRGKTPQILTLAKAQSYKGEGT